MVNASETHASPWWGRSLHHPTYRRSGERNLNTPVEFILFQIQKYSQPCALSKHCECWGHAADIGDLNAASLCCFHMMMCFYSGNKSLSGNASWFGYSTVSWCMFMWPWSTFCYHTVISNAAPWRWAVSLDTGTVFAQSNGSSCAEVNQDLMRQSDVWQLPYLGNFFRMSLHLRCLEWAAIAPFKDLLQLATAAEIFDFNRIHTIVPSK